MNAFVNIRRLMLLGPFGFMSCLTGCISVPLGAPVGVLNPAFEGQQLVIYRLPDNASLYFDGLLNGVPTKDYIKRGGVLIVPVPSGNHTFTVKIPAFFPSSSMSANLVSVEVKPRERKFIRVRTASGGTETRWGTSGVVAGQYNYVVEEVSQKMAEIEIRELKFVN